MKIHGCAVGALAVCFLGNVSCSRQAPPSPPASAAAAPAPSSSSGGRIVGTVPPPTGAVPVIVVLEPQTPREFPPQTEKPAMDQVGATFGPALLFVRTGQPTEFRNSDDVLHNVHVTHQETHEPQFNVAIPTGETWDFTFKREGFYHVGCDIHPAMSAEIFASSSPYVTIADSAGNFTFEDIAAGPYLVTVYAGIKRTQKDVDVTGGETQIRIE